MIEWVSVKDKLPEYGAEVIVVLNYKRRRVACFSYRGKCDDTGRLLWRWHNSDDESTLTVTHWMPLPEPPKEEE